MDAALLFDCLPLVLMGVDVHRRRGESFDGLLRRFGRKVQMSGRLLQAKKIRFHRRRTSKAVERTAAVTRAYRRSYLGYLEKIGKLEEELEKMKSKRRRR